MLCLKHPRSARTVCLQRCLLHMPPASVRCVAISFSVYAGTCAPGAALVEQCCCFRCHRYSPNLSKRTTHLVTSQVVGSLSDKLAAAAAAGSRFNAHIVSIGWVAACAARKGKAAEVQYAPALPGAKQVSQSLLIYATTVLLQQQEGQQVQHTPGVCCTCWPECLKA
jgi:hypothetical protein